MENTGARPAEEARWTVTCGVALDGDRLCIAATRGDPLDRSSDFAILVYDGPSRGWTVRPAAPLVTSLATLPDVDGDARVFALSRDGRVESFSPAAGPGVKAETESISRLIPGHPRKRTYGELTTLQRIGHSLFACGASGQLYRRDAFGAWAHADAGLLHVGSIEKGDLRVAGALGGSSEQDVHVLVGEFRPEGLVGRLFHHDGEAWSRVDLPTDQLLGGIFVEDEEHVHLCGLRSTVLAGNRRRGFGPVVPSAGPHAFAALAMFEDTLYLGSSYGVVRHDRVKRHYSKVRTGLDREPWAIHTLSPAGGVLWCVGEKDVLRYAGQSWSRVELPE